MLQAAVPLRTDAASIGFFISCVAAAAMVASIAVGANGLRACAVRESLADGLCRPPPAQSAREAEQLRARIARNPGDANAYTELALNDTSAQRERLVAVAGALAPREPNLMLARAAAAYESRDWDTALPLLVELAEHRPDATYATSALATLILSGEGARLEPYIQPGTQWLGAVLTRMRATGAGLSGALPLVIRALNTGTLDAPTVRGYVRELKAAGAWADAYALWLSMHGKSVPLLFNASFDHAFELDGFDWEVPQQPAARRSGVVIERRRAEQRGAVLDLQFNGRAFGAPIVRQYLFIAPGRYRLRGDYNARQFRSEEGLTWSLRCGDSTAGLSGPLRDTLGLWQSFEFEIAVPRSCGVVASLQLDPTNPAEGALGARGRISFDAFSLERIGP